MKLITAVILTFFCISAAYANENVHVAFSTPQSVAQEQAMQDIKVSRVSDTIVDLSNKWFPFNNTLFIQFGGSEGPLYDPEKHTVFIPYHFYIESRHYFEKNDYEKKLGKSAKDGALDTLLHTLLHEAGHAFIADNRIPVLGKEEDAVDNFASIILLNYVDSGDDIAIGAADMFAFESDDRPDYYEFGEYIDEHSFDLQRYFSTLCLVYGSNPDKYNYLLDEVEQDYLKDRKEYCLYNFDAMTQNWSAYLGPNENQ